MAGKSPELTALARQVAALDDDALAALANKGLVRRAHKDLQKSVPRHTGADGDQLTFDVEGHRVLLGAVPTAAKCDCGASSVCRHVLVTLLYLRDQMTPSVEEPSLTPVGDPLTEIMDLSPEALESWAGKTLFRRALQAPRGDARFNIGATIVITLPVQNATVRWLNGQGLDGMLCTCHAAGACKHKVSAVLALWAREGRTLPELPARVLETSAGAPRSRDEVLKAVRQVLHEMVALGLERVSEATQNRLKTLGVSAHGVDLPRLERMLSVLATETELLLRRDAQGDATRILQVGAHTWALATALAQPTPELIGVHRTKYEQVAGELELIGVGARQWRTHSGYEGLTVYFWEPHAQRWNTWTDTRPAEQQFDPSARYTQEFPWPGVRNPREASRSRYRVSGVFRNPVGRLSGRHGARAVRVGDTELSHVSCVRQWPELVPRIERIFGGGLTQQVENDDVVLVVPARVADPVFDAVNQAMQRALIDPDERVLPLRLAYQESIPKAVEHIETVGSDELVAVLALLRAGVDGVHVEPVTLITEDRFIHITLDGVTTSRKATSTTASFAKDDSEANAKREFDVPDTPNSRVGLLLRQTLDRLEDVAEAGLRVQRDLAPLRAACEAFDTLSLTTCRDALRRTVAALEQSRRGLETADTAERLLECSFILRLALQQETTAVWSRRFA